MSFPADNNIFQKGTFEGFAVRGRARVDRDFRHAWENRSVSPGLGKHFAILDDPNLIDLSNGTRLPPSQILSSDLTAPASRDPLDTSDLDFIDLLSQKTRGIDGASLAVEGISLKPGEGIMTRWNFLVYDQRDDINDFALAELIDEQTGQTIEQKLLVQSQGLKSPDGSIRWSSGWMPYSWKASGSVRVTFRIVVSNGYTFNPLSGPDPLQRVQGRAFPSGLLVDGIWLI